MVTALGWWEPLLQRAVQTQSLLRMSVLTLSSFCTLLSIQNRSSFIYHTFLPQYSASPQAQQQWIPVVKDRNFKTLSPNKPSPLTSGWHQTVCCYCCNYINTMEEKSRLQGKSICVWTDRKTSGKPSWRPAAMATYDAGISDWQHLVALTQCRFISCSPFSALPFQCLSSHSSRGTGILCFQVEDGERGCGPQATSLFTIVFGQEMSPITMSLSYSQESGTWPNLDTKGAKKNNSCVENRCLRG